jgi:2-methylisocitrate lyase-like PEP mutase family enzyme
MKTNPAAFRERLRHPGLIVAPGVFDMVSLRLADSFGFDALYMTGYGTVASANALMCPWWLTWSRRGARLC